MAIYRLSVQRLRSPQRDCRSSLARNKASPSPRRQQRQDLLATAATHGGVISRAISNGKRFNAPICRAKQPCSAGRTGAPACYRFPLASPLAGQHRRHRRQVPRLPRSLHARPRRPRRTRSAARRGNLGTQCWRTRGTAEDPADAQDAPQEVSVICGIAMCWRILWRGLFKGAVGKV